MTVLLESVQVAIPADSQHIAHDQRATALAETAAAIVEDEIRGTQRSARRHHLDNERREISDAVRVNCFCVGGPGLTPIWLPKPCKSDAPN